MAILAIQSVLQSGLAPTFAPATLGGDTFANDERIYLHVKNGAATATTVTVNSFTVCNHGFDHDLVISVPAAGERLIGPFQASRFNNDTSTVGVTYSAVTTVTVAAIRV
jgi:hypothetical protein